MKKINKKAVQIKRVATQTLTRSTNERTVRAGLKKKKERKLVYSTFI